VLLVPLWLVVMWGGYVFKRRRAVTQGGAQVAGR
jgi:aromatic amino acid transport protein AroP